MTPITYRRAGGASEAFAVDPVSAVYKCNRESEVLIRPCQPYFVTFASNFSRTFFIFGFAWKVQ